MHPSYSALAVALCCLALLPGAMCASLRGLLKAADGQAATPDVLWVAVNKNRDCTETCRAVNLESMRGDNTGDSTDTLCSYVVDGQLYPGIRRDISAAPGACQIVSVNGTVRRVHQPTANYQCGCLPPADVKPVRAQGTWTFRKDDPCGEGLVKVDAVCRFKNGTDVFMGWINSNSKCTFVTPPSGVKPRPLSVQGYGCLCIRPNFAYVH